MNKKIVEIIIPIRNESKVLENNIKKLFFYLKGIGYNFIIHIAESNSQDNCLEIAKNLSKNNNKILVSHFDKPGRDFALKYIWMNSKSDILAYMDADLSTDLLHFKDLVRAIDEGYDIAIGSRIKKGSQVKRPLIRICISKLYNNLLIPIVLPTGVKDAQCGFKAINQKVAKNILPKLSENNGFLDTELLAVSYSKGYKIKEIPVKFSETRKSNMSVWKNIPNFLKNAIRTRIKIILKKY